MVKHAVEEEEEEEALDSSDDKGLSKRLND